MDKIVERFLKYVKIDTQSDSDSTSSPTTEKQFVLAKLLVNELNDIGLKNVNLDEFCTVMAELPSNTDKNIPTIGFLAHMDTALDFTGANVNPNIITNYDGKDIILNKQKDVILKTKDFPEILQYVGEDIIVTDGTTLLGADDKAGIAEIVTAVEYLVNNPDIKHGTIKIAFTPDEETGRGTDNFDVEKFNADFAYTIDGGGIGGLDYENFNAAKAKITVNGRNVHPGAAKSKMINSLRIANELDNMLPIDQKPEYTEGYEGFFHLLDINGNVEKTCMKYLIRDHDKNKLEQKKKLFVDIAEFLNKKYLPNTIELEIKDEYSNMKEKIEPVIHIIETAKKAMKDLGIEPDIKPIRAGTDGAMLSYRGLPTPNIFTGGHNFHGKYEYIPISSMKASVNVILKIIELYSKK